MKRIDEIYTDQPYYGSPKITAQLKREGIIVNHKRIERLMRLMGISAIIPTKNISKHNKSHSKYLYLLKGLYTNCPNQAWGSDITYIRANKTWFYLTVILDWFFRYVISWQLSKSLSPDFCVKSLKEALSTAILEIHNSDQGSQFTSDEYLNVLKEHPGIKISMDGGGRRFDNIFNERLWRTVKYEEVYLHDYQTFEEAKESLTNYFQKYNHRRLHESLGHKAPAEVYFQIPRQQFLKVDFHLKNLNLLSK